MNGQSEAQAVAAATETPPPKSKSKNASGEWPGNALGGVIGFLAIGWPFLIIAWQAVPLSTALKLIIIALALSILVLSYVFFKARTVRAFELTGNFITVSVIVLGAAIFASYFGQRDRTI